jgi:hypothetical protein
METIEQKINRMTAAQMRAALINLAKWADEPNYLSQSTPFANGYHDGVGIGKEIIIARIEAAAKQPGEPRPIKRSVVRYEFTKTTADGSRLRLEMLIDGTIYVTDTEGRHYYGLWSSRRSGKPGITRFSIQRRGCEPFPELEGNTDMSEFIFTDWLCETK